MLLIFYMAAKCVSPLAHRELMDMILAVQRTRILGVEMEMVSKTKVRGILALLKNSHALLATAGNGDSARLYLGKAVTSFRMFREKHDTFINHCILQQHIFLPVTVKNEVVWQGDEQAIFEKSEALRQLEPPIEEFIMRGVQQQQQQVMTQQSQSQRFVAKDPFSLQRSFPSTTIPSSSYSSGPSRGFDGLGFSRNAPPSSQPVFPGSGGFQSRSRQTFMQEERSMNQWHGGGPTTDLISHRASAPSFSRDPRVMSTYQESPPRVSNHSYGANPPSFYSQQSSHSSQFPVNQGSFSGSRPAQDYDFGGERRPFLQVNPHVIQSISNQNHSNSNVFQGNTYSQYSASNAFLGDPNARFK